MLHFKLRNGESAIATLRAVERNLVIALVALIRSTAYAIQSDTRKDMRSGIKTGRLYNYLGKAYRASAPGETPAVRSGRLYRSIATKIKSGGLQATIGTDVPYAARLKRDRPILSHGLAKNEERFVNSVRRLVQEASG